MGKLKMRDELDTFMVQRTMRLIKTRSRILELRRRRVKEPSQETRDRVRYLEWLTAKFGPMAVADWHEPPISFEEWKKLDGSV